MYYGRCRLRKYRSKYLSDNTFYTQINSKMRREGFFNSAGFSNDPISAGTAANQVKFKDTLPNVVYNNDKTLDLAQLGSSFDPVLSRQFSPLKNEWKQTTVTTPQVIQMQAACENARNGDQFAHLSSMASSVDTTSRLRCGWVYNTGDYTKGRGALGTINGPIEKNVSGTWMWDLNAAKKKYHTEICNNITNCGDIGASMYNGRCGWCKKAGKAVPVSGGVAAYPFSSKTACPPTRLQNNANKCTEAFVNPSVCTPLPNGALSRDCLMQKLIEVGCNDEGSMYQALRSGSDNDYLSQLKQQQAWSVYQNRSRYPLDETALSTGKMTIANALDNASFVQITANSDSGSASNYAARDLCFKKGELESYDFCSELTDSTNGPFTLDCLQSAFKVAGGQTTGKAYPSASTSSKWNALGTWAAVKEEINTMRNNTQSSNRVTQENAMINFYGITLQNKQTPLQPPPPPALTVTVGQHCERGQGWQMQLGISKGLKLGHGWISGVDFPADASSITVPQGLVALLMNSDSVTHKVIGPNHFNFCSKDRFNDNVRYINVFPNLNVIISQNCDGTGWQKNLTPGRYLTKSFQALLFGIPASEVLPPNDMPVDVGYIKVPAGLRAVLTDSRGYTIETIDGPREFKLCNKYGFKIKNGFMEDLLGRILGGINIDNQP